MKPLLPFFVLLCCSCLLFSSCGGGGGGSDSTEGQNKEFPELLSSWCRLSMPGNYNQQYDMEIYGNGSGSITIKFRGGDSSTFAVRNVLYTPQQEIAHIRVLFSSENSFTLSMKNLVVTEAGNNTVSYSGEVYSWEYKNENTLLDSGASGVFTTGIEPKK